VKLIIIYAQQARRVLDRLVGYELSLFYGEIKGGFQLVVQSVSVRLIVDERDIQNFNAIASYSIVAEFTNETGKSFKAKLPKNFNTKRSRRFFK
jgi:DNA topoisomerase-1